MKLPNRSAVLIATACLCIALAGVGCTADNEDMANQRVVSGTWPTANERALIEFTAESNCRSIDAWLAGIGKAVVDAWLPPPVFVMGLIWGETRVTVCFESGGSVRSYRVVEALGHASLHDASVTALENMVPPGPLPACVNADSLVLDLRFRCLIGNGS